MDILKIIFYSILFILPFGEFIRVNLANGVVVKPVDALVGLIVVIWLVLHIVKKKKINKINLILPIIIFSSICVLSLLANSYLLTSNELLTSFLYLVRWLFYSGLYFVVREFDEKFKNKISFLMIVIGGIFVFIGYIQYFFYQNLHNLLYLGWDGHMYRMFSSFFDPNFAGAFFVLSYLLILGFLIDIKNKKYSKNKVVLFIFTLFSTLGAIFLTFSRSSLVMLIVSSTFLLFVSARKKWILVLFAVIAVVFIISSRYFYIENINPFRVFSAGARLETTRNALRIIYDHPILGVGFNAYRYMQVKYGFRHGIGAEVSHADAGVDNSLLFVLATSGILGLLSYIFIGLEY